MFGTDVASFRLHLAAENKAERTIKAYTEAVRWFAAAHLLCQTSKTRWEHVDKQDMQRWMVHLLGRYSEAYAYQQYRALQEFIRFRHHFSHTWLDRGGAEGGLMELNGWSSPQMLTRYGASARAARARRSYDLIMND